MRRFLLVCAVLTLAGCGGGGGGNNNNPPPAVLLAAQRYFPSPLGAHYVYRPSVTPDTFAGLLAGDFEYIVEPNPLGSGVYYNAVDQDGFRRGPVFNGLRFSGLSEENEAQATVEKFVSGPLSQADILPSGLSALNEQWAIDVQLGRPGAPFLTTFNLNGTAEAAAIEEISLGTATLEDCLRVDATFTYRFLAMELPAFTASYWLAPDLGPALGILRVAGVEVARVELVSATL
jgi:hypothetical protein